MSQEQASATETPEKHCRVYWGSHGCSLGRGHGGSCFCFCAVDPDSRGGGNVGAWPYYGPETRFYGDDDPPFATRSITGRPYFEDEDE